MGLTLSDLEKKYGFDPGTLRYYDQKGILPIFHRNKANQRYIDNADESVIELLFLLKNSGCSLKRIQSIISLIEEGKRNPEQLLQFRYEILQILLENESELLEKVTEIMEQIQISKYVTWYFTQSTKYSSPLDILVDSKAQFNGTLPEYFCEFLDKFGYPHHGKNSDIDENTAQQLKSFRDKYPDYPVGSEVLEKANLSEKED